MSERGGGGVTRATQAPLADSRAASRQPVTSRLAGAGPAGSRLDGARRPAAWVLGAAGLAAYNWWLLVPLKPGLMRSPDEFFSNLEVTGQPYAAVMQHCDVASGLLLVAAFLLAGNRSLPGASREWLGLVTFGLAGLVGGLFPQVCADGISATCMAAERHFQLPVSQYVHDGAGIVEFAGITLALLLALRRTVRQAGADGTRGARGGAPARIYLVLAAGAVVAYPLLGLAYLTSRFGGVIEGLFFTGFTIMILTQLAERLATKTTGHRSS